MRKFLLLLIVLTSGLCLPPQVSAERISGVALTEYGIFRCQQDQVFSEDGAIGGKIMSVVNVSLDRQTIRIPMVRGVRFGFRYSLEGEPQERDIEIQHKAITPGLLPSPKEKLQYLSRWTSTTTLGSNDNYVMYSLDEDWELVPGTWRLQVVSKGRVLAEKTFIVDEPYYPSR